MSQTLAKLIEEVKALSEQERRQLAAMLQSLNGGLSSSCTEEELEAKLAAEGWLSLPTPPPSNSPTPQLTSPIEVRGRPTSEIIIEERR